jgi:hypothetical protein
MIRLLFYFLLLLAAAGATSCKPTQMTSERFYSDTTIIKEIPRIIEVPGDTLISYSINIDSLAALLRAGVPPHVIEKMTIREDPVTKNRVGILIDELGNLTALCEIQNQQIQYLEKEITRLTSDRESMVVTDKIGFFARIGDAINMIVIILLLVLVIGFFLKK